MIPLSGNSAHFYCQLVTSDLVPMSLPPKFLKVVSFPTKNCFIDFEGQSRKVQVMSP